VIDFEEVRAASRRIAPHVVRTPVLRLPYGGAQLFLKAENLQPVGSFKIRGAFNRMLQLPENCPGVVAHSSGNHGLAVSHAARVLEIPATIVVPSDAPRPKREGIEREGATLVSVGPDSEERRTRALEIAETQGLVLIPPYDDLVVAAGQGTVALELLEDVDALDRLYCPVSGGGLIAGCATVATVLDVGEMVGVEPEGADDTRRSLAAGRRVSIAHPETIADGLKVQIPGERVWPVIRALVDRVVTVSDEEIEAAMAVALFRSRIVLEPSGAASLAAALREGRGRCGVILSGGNVERELLVRIVKKGPPP
jgi:threonine dehydratase